MDASSENLHICTKEPSTLQGKVRYAKGGTHKVHMTIREILDLITRMPAFLLPKTIVGILIMTAPFRGVIQWIQMNVQTHVMLKRANNVKVNGSIIEGL